MLFTTLLAYSAIAKAQSLTYCIDPNWAPYEYIEAEQHKGISAYYLKRISELTNLQLTFLKTDSWQESLSAIENGHCDITPLLNYSESRAKTISFSKPYFYAPNVIFAHYQHQLVAGLSKVSDESIGVVKGYRLVDYLKGHYPEADLVQVNSELDGLTRVNNQKLDLFVSSFYAANYLIHQHNLTNMRIVGIAEVKDQLRFGVRHAHKDLIPRLNASIEKLSHEDHHKAFIMLEPVKVITQTNYSLAWEIAAIGSLLLVILASRHYYSLKQRKALARKNSALERLHRALEKKNKQLEELAVKDHLTQLHNRSYLSGKVAECINSKKRYKTECCLLLIDIDDFKQFNDSYGHQIGDDVLVTLARTLELCARETDFTARWGGEEFVIICPETNLHDALHLANRFREALATAEHACADPITCSIGIAELGYDDSQESWFTSADNALYRAKGSGKDKVSIASD